MKDHETLWIAKENSFQADYPLAFEVEQLLDGRLNVTLAAQAKIADVNVAKKLFNDFEHALRRLLKDPQQRVAESFKINDDAGSGGFGLTINKTECKHKEPLISGVEDLEDFHWSAEAKAIRDTINGLEDGVPAEVGPHTSILALGLDSIDAIKLSSRLKDHCRILLPVSTIMRHPTVAGMVEHVQRCDNEESKKSLVDLEKVEQILRSHLGSNDHDLSNVERVLPATPLQEAMIAEMLDSGYRAYLNHDILKVDKEVDLKKLRHAWQTVQNGTPILRTGFAVLQDPAMAFSFTQLVRSSAHLPWTEIALPDGASLKDVMESTRAQIKAERLSEPPMRLTLVSKQHSKNESEYLFGHGFSSCR